MTSFPQQVAGRGMGGRESGNGGFSFTGSERCKQIPGLWSGKLGAGGCRQEAETRGAGG